MISTLSAALTGLQAVLEHPVVSLVVFLALAVGFVAAFARAQTGDFLLGTLRAVVSILYSPFLFMRKAVTALSAFWARPEEQETHSDTYLINRGLVILHVLVVFAGLALLAGGLAAAIARVIPSKEVRQAAVRVRAEVKAATTEAASAQRDLEAEQARWQTDRTAIVAQHRGEAERRRDEFKAEMRRLAGPIEGQPALSELQGVLGPTNADGGLEDVTNRRDAGRSNAQRVGWWDGQMAKRLRQYVDAWYNACLQDHEARFLPEDEIGQRLLQAKQERAQQLKEALTQSEEAWHEIKREATSGLRAFPRKAARSIAGFLAFIWLLGVTVEWFGLFVRLADNVRLIREARL